MRYINALTFQEIMQEDLLLKRLAHTSLDAELKGRVGLAGDQFKHAIAYLSDYLKEIVQDPTQLGENYSNIQSLSISMQQLALYEAEINLLNGEDAQHEKINTFAYESSRRVMSLQPGEELLFPGGWDNKKGSGHAMIYQFNRDEQGRLIFSIYNSGDGIAHHEKVSTTNGEQFFPVKKYAIPEPIDNKELSYLLETIALCCCPRHPGRTGDLTTINANKLYAELDKKLIFLNAEVQLVSADTRLRRFTTTGQLSGTCTQRSLHQLMKVHFDTLENYQHFILNFKMHALREFIATHPIPRSPKIAELLKLAIENNLKILKQPGVMNNPDEKRALEEELMRCKEQVLSSNAVSAPLAYGRYVHDELKSYQVSVQKNSSDIYEDHQAISIKARIDVHKPNMPDFSMHEKPLALSEVEQLISGCKDVLNQDPLWVLKQIEQAIIHFPLPKTTQDFITPNPFYQEIERLDQFQTLVSHMSTLQGIYNQAIGKSGENPGLSPFLITQCSMVALADQFNEQHAQKHHDPLFHPYLGWYMNRLLEHISYSPQIATHHVGLDEQLIKLRSAYQESEQKYLPNELLNYYNELVHRDRESSLLLTKLCKEDASMDADSIEQLKKSNAFGLYYLLTRYRNDGLTSLLYEHPTLSPLIEKIQHMIDFETLIVQGLDACFSSERKPTLVSLTCVKINGRPHLQFNSPVTELAARIYSNHAFTYSLTGACNKALSYGNSTSMQTIDQRRTENSIELHEKTVFERQLYYLRLSPSNQINFTLDYFTHSLDRFHDLNVQSYFRANLFAPGLLINELKNPEFMPRFDDFIQRGLRYFQSKDSRISSGFLFFIRLRMEVDCYTHEWSASSESRAKLSATLALINTQIQSESDPETLASLHRYRLILANAIPEQISVEARLLSYFYVQTNANVLEPESAYDRFKLRQINQVLQEWIKTISPEQLSTVMKLLVAELLSLNTADLTLSGDYPRFSIIDTAVNMQYTIDIEQGKIYCTDHALSKIPAEIQQHPLFEQLNLDRKASCFISEDGSLIQFPEAKVRIKRRDGAFIAIQKELTVNGQMDWYELVALSDEQYRTFFLIDSSYKKSIIHPHQLPACLTDDSTQAWVKTEGGKGVIFQNNQAVYWIESTGELRSVAHQDNVLKSNSVFHQYLTQFEDPEFFCVNLNDTTKTGSIDLVRYGLTLTVEQDRIQLPNSTLSLVSNSHSPFQHEVAHLTFADEKQTKCILPVQRFYLDPVVLQKKGEYVALTHDISGRIATNTLQEMSLKSINWHYKDSENYMVYPLVQGIPKPDTAASALYLCYVYLASHEQQKAWDVLDDLSRRLSMTGSAEELTFLSWIIEELPHQIKNIDNSLVLESPREVACKLKALSLYTEFLADGGKPSLPAEQAIKSTTANEYYAQESRKQIINFHKQLKETIDQHYSKLSTMRDHLSEYFSLSDNECQSLLNFYMPRQESSPAGALAYERRRLTLKQLLKERRALDAVQNKSASMVKRIAEIDEVLKNQQDIMKVSTILEKAQVNLSTPFEFDRTAFNPSWININRWGCDFTEGHDEAIGLLSSKIKDEDLIEYFPAYLTIARTPAHPQQEKLKQFCSHYLIAHRDALAASSTAHLVQILYRILSNPEKLRDVQDVFDLNRLYSASRIFDPEPLFILQAKNVFHEILIDTQSMIAEIAALNHPPAPLQTQAKNKNIIERILADEALTEEEKIIIQQRVMKNITIESRFIQKLKNNPSEMVAGGYQYENTQDQRSNAAGLLLSSMMRKKLLNILKKIIDEPRDESNTWTKVLLLANQAMNPVDIAAGVCRYLSEKDLRQCYFHADVRWYRERTGLKDDQCITLHKMIHACVAKDIEQQHAIRAYKAIEAINDSSDEIKCAYAAQTLMSSTLPEVENDPTLMLFQYEEDVLLRPRQVQALRNLLSTPQDPHQFNEAVEKVIMGGGKSKVILPLLAQKKSTGLNLVVIEVPQALLNTNHTDLNSTSLRIFNQRAHRFEFNRDSDSSPERLEDIYNKFVNIMTNKEYLVTTGESMQSLELKYLELLLSKPREKQKKERWTQQVFWASKISELLKQRGDVVIDELHQGLLLKKKLNYTIGSPLVMSRGMLVHAVNFYAFTQKIGHYIDIDALLSREDSPLYEWVNTENKEALRAYLNNEAVPDCFEHASVAMKDAFAFYKEELKLWPLTQARHYKEHYGPSKIKDKSALERALAIPYSANDCPNERSRFGNPLEILNYTIQSLLYEGLNEELLCDTITVWKTQAQMELIRNPMRYHSLNETPTGMESLNYLAPHALSLAELEPKNSAQMQELLKHVQHNTPLLLHVLERRILPQITVEPQILHSDAYNHVDLYRSVQGVSGTPSNHLTYHHRLKFNAQTSLGTDGYIQQVLKEKQQGSGSPVHAISFNLPRSHKTLNDFLVALMERATTKNTVHAMIDINATFVGFSNVEVARALSHICQDRTPPIKYILYYEKINDADVLHALDMTDLNKSIVLGSSDPDEINQRLSCKPDERFTYYDQAHTVGVDLKQADNATAFCLVDEHTHLQSFLQGCMRMRGLDQRQSIEVVVPEHMAESTLSNLIEKFIENETSQLHDDMFFSALLQMNNIVRSQLLQLIASQPDADIDTKYKWAEIAKHHLIEHNIGSIYDQYGAIYRPVETKEALHKHKLKLLVDWKDCLEKMGLNPESYIKQSVDLMEQVITDALPYCKHIVLSPECVKNNTEIELQQEQEKQKEQLKETLILDSISVEKKYAFWGKGSWLRRLNDSGEIPIYSKSLDWFYRDSGFSNTLLGTENYLEIVMELGSSTTNVDHPKPVHAMLFWRKDNITKAYLVTPREAEEIKNKLDGASDSEKSNIWLETPQQILLSGHRPEGVLQSKSYLSLLEQARFLNGGCAQLIEQETPFCWLSEDYDKKLNYFKDHIMNARETREETLSQLQELVQAELPGLDVFRSHPDDNLTQYDWESSYPDAPVREIMTYRLLARAYEDARQGLLSVDAYPLPYKANELLKDYQYALAAKQEPKTVFEYIHRHAAEKKIVWQEKYKVNRREQRQCEYLIAAYDNVNSGYPSELISTNETDLEIVKRYEARRQEAIAALPGIAYIKKHIDEDLTKEDWKTKYPKASEWDIEILTNCAKALSEVNQGSEYDVSLLPTITSEIVKARLNEVRQIDKMNHARDLMSTYKQQRTEHDMFSASSETKDQTSDQTKQR